MAVSIENIVRDVLCVYREFVIFKRRADIIGGVISCDVENDNVEMDNCWIHDLSLDTFNQPIFYGDTSSKTALKVDKDIINQILFRSPGIYYTMDSLPKSCEDLGSFILDGAWCQASMETFLPVACILAMNHTLVIIAGFHLSQTLNLSQQLLKFLVAPERIEMKENSPTVVVYEPREYLHIEASLTVKSFSWLQHLQPFSSSFTLLTSLSENSWLSWWAVHLSVSQETQATLLAHHEPPANVAKPVRCLLASLEDNMQHVVLFLALEDGTLCGQLYALHYPASPEVKQLSHEGARIFLHTKFPSQVESDGVEEDLVVDHLFWHPDRRILIATRKTQIIVSHITTSHDQQGQLTLAVDWERCLPDTGALDYIVGCEIFPNEAFLATKDCIVIRVHLDKLREDATSCWERIHVPFLNGKEDFLDTCAGFFVSRNGLYAACWIRVPSEKKDKLKRSALSTLKCVSFPLCPVDGPLLTSSVHGDDTGSVEPHLLSEAVLQVLTDASIAVHNKGDAFKIMESHLPGKQTSPRDETSISQSQDNDDINNSTLLWTRWEKLLQLHTFSQSHSREERLTQRAIVASLLKKRVNYESYQRISDEVELGIFLDHCRSLLHSAAHGEMSALGETDTRIVSTVLRTLTQKWPGSVSEELREMLAGRLDLSLVETPEACPFCGENLSVDWRCSECSTGDRIERCMFSLLPVVSADVLGCSSCQRVSFSPVFFAKKESHLAQEFTFPFCLYCDTYLRPV